MIKMVFKRFLTQKVTNKTIFNMLFYAAIILFCFICGRRFLYSSGLFMDNLEHIHASWLISEGFTPYRDFFEHHNPLLWYIFAPIVKFFGRQPIEIVYISRIIAILGYIYTLFLLYKVTVKYTNDKNLAKVSVLLCMSYPVIWYEVQNLRPDIFMYVFILMSLNYIFDYLDNHKTEYLCLSYFSLLIAFLFLQKTILYGFGFVVANVILIYKRKIYIKDVLYAILVPLFLIGILILILSKEQILYDWFYYNFTFNNYLVGYYKSGYYINSTMCLLAMLIIRYYKPTDKGNILFATWIMAFWGIVYFAPHSHYYFFYFILTMLLLSPCLKKLFIKQFMFFVLVIFFLLLSSFNRLYERGNRLHSHLNIIEYIVENSAKEDKLLNSHYPYNIFNFDTNFYWFGFHNIVIINDLFTDSSFNYNEEIKTSKPKFIFINNNLFDKTALKNSNWLHWRNSLILKKASKGNLSYLEKITEIVYDYWNVDMNFIQENYQFVESFNETELWQRIDN
ncbi:MAG: glycosyltransferase family 39 protein [Alphaproteobacteria bacterium]|nr:glycosyltransferase family 39 protein [Alphaproteobacteria bacterium]